MLQIVQCKLQIDDELQKNKKLKEKLIALQEEIERAVSINTLGTKVNHKNLNTFSRCVCVDTSACFRSVCRV